MLHSIAIEDQKNYKVMTTWQHFLVFPWCIRDHCVKSHKRAPCFLGNQVMGEVMVWLWVATRYLNLKVNWCFTKGSCFTSHICPHKSWCSVLAATLQPQFCCSEDCGYWQLCSNDPCCCNKHNVPSLPDQPHRGLKACKTKQLHASPMAAKTE